MVSKEIVRDHALSNIWCTPDHDRVIMVKAKRISPPGGSFRVTTVLWEAYELPTKEYYHVYQVGEVPMVLYNLPELSNKWHKAKDVVRDRSILSRLYTQSGKVYPLEHVWFRVTRDRNFIFVVKVDRQFPLDLEENDAWLYLYSNQFFNSQRWVDLKTSKNKPNATTVTFLDKKIVTLQDVQDFKIALQNAINGSVITANEVIYTVNGKYRSNLNGTNDIVIGDYIEAIVDSSIRSIRSARVSDMGSFVSQLEPKIKRLFPPEKSFVTIDFIDDIDFYLTKSTDNGVSHSDGLFYNQNDEESVRMVTHNSYSLVEQQIDGIVSNDDVLSTVYEDLFALAIVRHSGYKRPLLMEHHRTFELYKLSLEDINRCMLGIDSTVPEWRADILEASEYVKIMSSWEDQITETDCEMAYGYNLITKTFCDPYPVINGSGSNKNVIKPMGIEYATVSTYNNGLLLTNNTGSNGAILPLPAPSASASLAELTAGRVIKTGSPMRWWGTPTVTVDFDIRERGFRVYCCPIANNQPTEQWIDVTDQTNLYTFSNNGKTLTWDSIELNIRQYYPALIVGGEIIWNTVTFDAEWGGYLAFNIQSRKWVSPIYPTSMSVSPVIQENTLRIPTGVLDIFMDNESLIEGMDYIVNWPLVIVYKKPARVPPEGLTISYRTYGFCNTDMTIDGPREIGFVEGGIISANERRDLRDDANVRIVVGGKVMRKADLKFSEDYQNIVPSSLNGKPYGITNIVMPIEYFTLQETYAFRDRSQEVDTRVSDYLTTKIPGTTPPDQNPILDFNLLYSPFCSAIIYNLKNGWLDGLIDDGDYDNNDIANWLGGMVGLLAYDPALDLTKDMRYFDIRPHPYNGIISLTSAQYSFVEKVIRDYLTPPERKARVDLSSHVIIE